MGKIMELMPGADGKVRVAKVRMTQGILTRPLQRLFPLEVSSPKTLPAPRTSLVPIQEEGDEVVVVKTKSGRVINKPSRYGQWNY